MTVGVPTALMISGLLMLERDRKIVFPAWLCQMGDASYSLYLLHTLLISAMGKLWQHLHSDSIVVHIGYVCLMAVAAVILALLNYRFFEKPISKWYHKRLIS